VRDFARSGRVEARGRGGRRGRSRVLVGSDGPVCVWFVARARHDANVFFFFFFLRNDANVLWCTPMCNAKLSFNFLFCG
jgi:hypothetical protein